MRNQRSLDFNLVQMAKKIIKSEVEEKVEAPIEEAPVEEVKPVEKSAKKVVEYSEEDLAVMSREQFAEAIADIEAGKARVIPRTFIN
jgi:hypothetical protein